MDTHGVLYVHSAPRVVLPHVEWAVARVLGSPARLRWSAQPVDGSRRTEFSWTGRPGTAAEFATALRAWPMLRFEVTEEASPGCDGERYMCVPGLGVFRATTSAAGDLTVMEGRLRGALARVVAGPAAAMAHALREALDDLLGTAWDTDLEPYRHAGEGAPVVRLTQVS